MKKVDKDVFKRVYFIGVGGIGMSALAKFFASENATVEGADTGFADKEGLVVAGVSVFEGYDALRITGDIDAVVYTLATPDDNEELLKAKELGLPLYTYAEMLGIVSKRYFTIAVAGTHGKTTTTAMIAKVLRDAQKDPTVIVGSLLNDIEGVLNGRTNFIKGSGEYFVVEACEYKKSFLNLHPNIVVITNIEEDHLDFYKDLEDIITAFNDLALKVPKEGYIVCDAKNAAVRRALQGVKASVIDYASFLDLPFDLKVPGKHNIQNAAAAVAVATVLSIAENEAVISLNEFKGTWRRSEYKGIVKGEKAEKIIFDDYAHHPTEIKTTLEGFRERYPHHLLVVLFQPHLFSRTKQLFKDFVQSFDAADEIVLLPIYAAREKEDLTISSEELSESLQDRGLAAYTIHSFEESANFIKNLPDTDAVIITMGAGDVYKIGEMILKTDIL